MEKKSIRNLILGFFIVLIFVGIIFGVINFKSKKSPQSLQSIQTPQIVQVAPVVDAFCSYTGQAFYLLVLTIDNYSGYEDLWHVKCKILSKGNFVLLSPEEQTLEKIVKGTKSECQFLLLSKENEKIEAEVRFDGKSITVSTICKPS